MRRFRTSVQSTLLGFDHMFEKQLAEQMVVHFDDALASVDEAILLGMDARARGILGTNGLAESFRDEETFVEKRRKFFMESGILTYPGLFGASPVLTEFGQEYLDELMSHREV